MTGRDESAHTRAGTPGGTPVAVVGIGCRFPGANGLAQFWRLLSDGGDATTDVPASRYDIDAYHDPRPGTPNRIVSRRGGFLDQIDQFDAGYFGVAPREAERMDPQQRLLLETAAEALADAGLTRDRLSTTRTGVYVGGMSSAYGQLLSDASVLDLHAATGGARSFLAGRVSFAFDLRGPSMAVDCACSSSLAALHLAYQSVRNGETQLALAGGVNLVIAPEETIPFSAARMLAPDGRCKFGSAHGDGFVRSEGVAVLVLKPLDRAEADGDAVHAVIWGSAVGNDGQSGGYLLTPSQPGQEETLRAAYADAGVPAALVDYVEAHGTGTPLGDPIEVDALREAFAQLYRDWGLPVVPGRTGLGSVKANIGHLEAAAGVAGVVKVLLSMRHRLMPGLVGLRTPNPMIDLTGSPFRLQAETQPWEPAEGVPARAGVSSFGMGGSNVHVVVAEAERQ
ncbi:polyketide synthase [Micromonospora humida]|uniref:beta-ketoacyl [acyl carrier protein] synthase domain-containing protein n=1 Tax=Micromonospora humida TaxID=2809018 RepID=UPI003442E22E